MLKLISLFSGCGGFDLGFKKAGFQIVFSNDNEKKLEETYLKNLKHPILIQDIRDVNKKKIPQGDVIIAGIERSMEMVKHEMEFLARVDKPGSAVDAYVDELDAVLAERAADVERLRARVDKFRTLLRQEEELSTLVLSTTAAKC